MEGGDLTGRDADMSQEEEIRRRAYERYLARGGSGASGGSDLDDWLDAERELRDGREPDAVDGSRAGADRGDDASGQGPSGVTGDQQQDERGERSTLPRTSARSSRPRG
jgi:hypothetical protein